MKREQLIEKIKRGSGLTHPGTFHADDVLAACLLRLINPNFKIIRSNVIQNDFEGLVFDIGLGDYDHHQHDAKVRKDGVKYAAFGLLWKDLSSFFMDNSHADLFDKAFVSEIDRCDNSSDTNLLSSSIGLFNPTWDSNESQDKLFEEAVRFFTPVLKALIFHFRRSTYVPRYCTDMNECLNKAFNIMYFDITGEKIDVPDFADINDIWEKHCYRLIGSQEPGFFKRTFLSQVNRTYGKYKTSPFVLAAACLRYNERIDFLCEIMKKRMISIRALLPARKACEDAYEKSVSKSLIVFDQYIPTESLSERYESVNAVIFPSNRGGYTLLCANMNVKEKERRKLNPEKTYPRISLPVEIRGKDEAFLRKYHEGLFFVHPAGFMASCDTKESAVKLYQKYWSC